MKEELLRLAERCEAAQGPDRELDAAIGSTIYQMKVGREVPGIEGCYHELFTASLDAALTLIDDKRANYILHEAWSRLSVAHALHMRFWEAEDGDYRQCLARFVTAAALRASVKEQNNGE